MTSPSAALLPRPSLARPWLLLLCCLALAGCAGLGPQPASDLSWQQHRQSLDGLDHWELQGRLNIRDPEQSNTLSLRWLQEGADFDINLSGTLGAGAVSIQGDDQLVTMSRAGEAPVLAEDLESISLDYLGFVFPATDLYYWVRGLPAPDKRNRMDLNEQRQLAHLEQSGWRLQYDRYRPSGDYYLPHRIVLERQPYRLTFLVNRWQVNAAQAPAQVAEGKQP